MIDDLIVVGGTIIVGGNSVPLTLLNTGKVVILSDDCEDEVIVSVTFLETSI